MERHPNARLEAFCDAVFAIALTLLVIDIKLPADSIASNADFWLALKHMAPSIFAFVLSFIIIFITWVSHHSVMSGVSKSSASFIYANAILLLGVVVIPFPTRLLGDYILTDHAAPAVMIYNAVPAFQAVGWLFLTGAALRGKLTRNGASLAAMRTANRNAYGALAFYTALTVAAFWYPLTVAVISTLTWIFWFFFGISTLGKSLSE
jgi:uncharacterized membrane protein